MSANNQILVADYKNRWYVFNYMLAESWDEKNNLSIQQSQANFKSKQEAMEYAEKLYNETEWPDEIEYGIGVNILIKDNSKVIITE
jgi:hypothetical protein